MSEDGNVVRLRQPEEIVDPLTTILRTGVGAGRFGHRPGGLGFRHAGPGLGRGQGGAQSGDVVRDGVHGRYFTIKRPRVGGFPASYPPPDSSCRSHPAASGRQVFWGMRQSIPSSR